MADTTSDDGVGTAAGTVVDSSAAQGTVGTLDTAGKEASSTKAEPMVMVGDREVSLSVAKNALRTDEEFTQNRQKLSEDRKALGEREAALMERETAVGDADALLSRLSDPKIAQALLEVDPGFAAAIPDQGARINAKTMAENLRLSFENFSMKHPEFDDDKLSGIRAEAVRLAKSGRVDEAKEFESIGYRLYQEDIINSRAAKLVADRDADEKRKEELKRKGGGLSPGAAQIPGNVDIDKLSPIQKISLGRQMREAAKKMVK